MKRFIILAVILGVTSALLYWLTSLQSTEGAVTRFLDIPVIDDNADYAWISVGHEGVIVLGIGFGLVEFGMYGVGVFFATGQACAGLIALGQAAFGPVAFLCQLGIGLTGAAQVAVGGQVIGQGELGPNGAAFLKRLSSDLDDLLRLRRAA
ncbi:hypothetical protein BH09MYX1_BH09MYX1_56990 [soil metagenome]